MVLGLLLGMEENKGVEEKQQEQGRPPGSDLQYSRVTLLSVVGCHTGRTSGHVTAGWIAGDGGFSNPALLGQERWLSG